MDIGNSVEAGFDRFFEWLPNLLGALAILLVGYFVARALRKLVRKSLQAIGFDAQVMQGRVGDMIERAVSSPTIALGTIVYWLVLLGALSLAVTALGIDALTAFVGSVYAYLPHVLAALVIFLVAATLSTVVAALIARVMGDTSTGKVAATAAPVLIMTVATFMILTELMIAEEIVLITYAGIVGAIALGSALAFGLGGREEASKALSVAVEKGKEQRGQLRQDLSKGRTQTRRFVRRQQDEVSIGSTVEDPRMSNSDDDQSIPPR